MPHHRFINFGLGLEPAGSGKAGGERARPATAEDRARALRAAKEKLEGMKIEGFKIVDVVDPATFKKSSSP